MTAIWWISSKFLHYVTMCHNVTHCVTMVCERKNLDSKMTLKNVNFTFQMSKLIFKGVKTFTEQISNSVHFVRSLQTLISFDVLFFKDYENKEDKSCS